LNMEALCKLPHFEKWRKIHGYIYVYNTWSRHTKSGSGYAGVCVFSKIKPTLVEFGLESESPTHEGRCVTLHFATQIVVGTYAQCSGYDTDKIVLRRLFDGALKKYLAKKKSEWPGKQIVLAGDLNVNPRDCDFDPKAFAHMRRQKEVNHAPYDPGCSPEERRQYMKKYVIQSMVLTPSKNYILTIEARHGEMSALTDMEKRKKDKE